jgi:hypothetical protein
MTKTTSGGGAKKRGQGPKKIKEGETIKEKASNSMR